MTRTQWLLLAVICAVAIGVGAVLSHMKEKAPQANGSAPQYPQRIICMAPNIAETVFAIGAGDRVVGVSQFTMYPEEARNVPSVGAFYNPNLELIISLKPDLVIVQDKLDQAEQLCAAHNIPVMHVKMLQLDTILSGIGELGERLGNVEQARALQRQIMSELAEVKARTQGLPKVDTFLCISHTPGSLRGLFTVGNRSFLHEMLEIAGGKNIYGEMTEEYPQVSIESLVERTPQVILETYANEQFTEAELVVLRKDWAALPDLPAVKNDRVHFLTDDFIVVPGPRVAKIAARFASVLHPEIEAGK